MYVCEKCMANTPFAQFISETGSAGTCSFTHEGQGIGRVIALDALLDEIRIAVTNDFEPDEGQYDDDDDEPVVTTLDSFYLMEAIGLGSIHSALFELIRPEFSDTDWIRHDPMAPTEYAVCSSGWSRFKHAVMHSHRYTFWQHYDPDKSEYDPEHIHLANIPEMLMGTVQDQVTTLASGTKMWRVQVLNAGEGPSVPDRFTSPPIRYATQPNRMSPAGVPMFYGALELNTAISETVDFASLIDKTVWGVQFETVREFPILDLTPAYGPLHHTLDNMTNHSGHYGDEFLEEFARDLSQPIGRDGKESIEYVPTQVFTECVRYVMKNRDEQPIYGIKYTSSKTGQPCCVIFADQDQCVDGKVTVGKPQLLRAVPETLTRCDEELKKAE